MNSLVKVMLGLKGVSRWGATHTISHENVSSHTSEVAMLVWVLVNHHNAKSVDKVDLADALSAALLHDLVETVTGDMITPAKALIGRELVAQAESKAQAAIVATSPNVVQGALEATFYVLEQSESVIKQFVKVCDRFCALAFAAREVRCGNVEMKNAFERSREAFFEDGLHLELLEAIGVDKNTASRTTDWLEFGIDTAVTEMLA